LRRASELARNDEVLANQIRSDLQVTEHRAVLAPRLPAVLRGSDTPKDAAERLEFAMVGYQKKHYGASVRLFTEAFGSDLKLAEDMKAGNRYSAACAAALAGCDKGKDDPSPDDATRTRWREKAREWLSADLAAWRKSLEGRTPQTREQVEKTLAHWKVDQDLAGLRDEAELAKLPELERRTCRSLWTGVDALLKRATTIVAVPQSEK
jgi:serine/threonine-protein kinase